MRNKNYLFLLLSFCLVSCSIGPNYVPLLQPDDSGLNLRGKKVIVSKFLQAKSQISITHSKEIINILESAQVKDISYHIARHLNKAGIEAFSIQDAKQKQLTSDEVLIRGAIVTGPLPESVNMPIPFILNFLLIGNILPTPFPYRTGVDLTFRYEVIDHSGRILYQSGDKRSRITYKHYWVWGIFPHIEHENTIADAVPKQICELMVQDLFK